MITEETTLEVKDEDFLLGVSQDQEDNQDVDNVFDDEVDQTKLYWKLDPFMLLIIVTRSSRCLMQYNTK